MMPLNEILLLAELHDFAMYIDQQMVNCGNLAETSALAEERL